MPDPSPQNIDVAKLYELLRNTEQQQQIGRRVLKAVIIDVLRSKAAGNGAINHFLRSFPTFYGFFRQSCVASVLQQLIENVTLTEEERRILDELEKEEDDGHSPRDG
jgi:hypothetical protein